MANTKVTTRVIADDAITSDKLASGLTLGGVTTASGDITAQGNITLSSNANVIATRSLLARDVNGLNIGTTGATTALSIDNSANVTMPQSLTVSGTLTAALTGSLASATTATTQSASDNSTKVATTAYVTTAIANLVDSAPSTLDTLNELAAALGDDANFSTTVTNSIATKLPLAGGTMTGALNMGSQNITHAGTIASGSITTGDSSTAAFLRAHYSDGSYMTLEGYGLVMNRGASYIRPSTDGDKYLYIGGADDSLDWNAIHFRTVNGLYMTGTKFIDASRNLVNIGTVSSGAITSTGIITADQFTSASGAVTFRRGGSSTARILIESGNTTSGQNFIVNGTITSSGNVGVKVPSLLPFRANSNEGAIQVGKRGVIYADTGITTQIGNNTYITSANQRVAIENDFGSFYEQYQGKHSFYATTAAESVNALQTFNLQLMMLQNGNVGVGVASPPNTLTIAHQNHGIGLDYVGSTLPDIAGLFTSSTAHTSTAYGDLNIKARTDYGGFYDIGFFTSTNNQTPVLRGAYRAEGDIIHPAIERSIADNGILRFTKTASIGASGNDPVFTITKVSYGLYIAGTLTLILVDVSSPWGIQYRRYGVIGRTSTYSGGNTMGVSLTSEATYSNIDYTPNFGTVDTRTSGQTGGTFVVNMNTNNNGTATVKVIFQGYAAGVTLT